MKSRDFLALSAVTTAGELGFPTLAAERNTDAIGTAEPFSWTAYGLTLSFDFYKLQLRRRFLIPADSASAENAISNGKPPILTHRDPVLNLRIQSYYDAFKTLPVVRRYTRVTHLGSQPVGIEYVSSAMLADFASSLNLEKSLRIHLCYNSWQAGGQWHAWRPSELGLFPNREFSVSGAFVDSLRTRWSERYLPMTVIENTALNLTWFSQIEYSGLWHWEISQTSAETLYAHIGGPDEQRAHAWKNLQPGETYQTVPVAIGCVLGDFAETIERLAGWRHPICARSYQDRNRSCP